jgi:hypothetical protein
MADTVARWIYHAQTLEARLIEDPAVWKACLRSGQWVRSPADVGVETHPQINPQLEPLRWLAMFASDPRQRPSVLFWQAVHAARQLGVYEALAYGLRRHIETMERCLPIQAAAEVG